MDAARFRLVSRLLAPSRDDDAIREFARAKDLDRLLHWLDIAGLSLYLLHNAEHLDFASELPQGFLDQLRLRRKHYQRRSLRMLLVLERALAALREAHIPALVMKGFSAGKVFSPDPFARHQNDIDFLVPQACMVQAGTALLQSGFAIDSNALEFETSFTFADGPFVPEDEVPLMYRCQPITKLELHHHIWEDLRDVSLPHSCDPFQNSRTIQVGHVPLPVMSPAVMFVLNLLHAFRHLIFEGWVRPSWFYEIAYALRNFREDTAMWNEVLAALQGEKAIQAAGLILRFVALYFEVEIPLPMRPLMVTLPRPLETWFEVCGDTFLFTPRSQTKLHFLIFKEFCAQSSTAESYEKARVGVLLDRLRTRTLPKETSSMSTSEAIRFLSRRAGIHLLLDHELRVHRRKFAEALQRNPIRSS